MVYFKNRKDAGIQLAHLLEKYKDNHVLVFGLPRGGVVVAQEIAQALHASLGLIFAHKIGHPLHSEYAIGAISESGNMEVAAHELLTISKDWLENQKDKELEVMKKRRKIYFEDGKEVSVEGKIAIIVDDGIATGLTMKAGIRELLGKKPKKVIVAIPVASLETVEELKKMVDEVVVIEAPENYKFLGAVGAYYDEFYQVSDQEVKAILNKFDKCNTKQDKRQLTG